MICILLLNVNEMGHEPNMWNLPERRVQPLVIKLMTRKNLVISQGTRVDFEFDRERCKTWELPKP